MPALMRPNPVAATLRAGGAAYGTMVFEFFTPGLMAILAGAGADLVLIDTEHSGVGIETIKAQVAASRGLGIVPMVRVPGCHYHLIAPVLDAGAMGIMVPMVRPRRKRRRSLPGAATARKGCAASPSACRMTITAAAMSCKSCARPTSARLSSR